MHSINEKSKTIMKVLIAQMDDGYLKLDNASGTFMPLSMEKVTDEPGFTAVYSLAHYGEQNGDLMADPEITFGESDHEFYPLSFRNDYVGVYQEVIAEQVNLKRQKELADFTAIWLMEIVEQQSIKL
ncbi:MAG: hypothetical protein WCI51_20190 [Lentisphaerota bacterium]